MKKKIKKKKRLKKRPLPKIKRSPLKIVFVIFIILLILGNLYFFYLGKVNAKEYQLFAQNLQKEIAQVPNLSDLPKDNFQNQLESWEDYNNIISSLSFSNLTIPQKMGANDLISAIQDYYSQFNSHFEELKALVFLEEHQNDFNLAQNTTPEEKEAAYAALLLRLDFLKRSQGIQIPSKFVNEKKAYEDTFNDYYNQVRDSQEKIKNGQAVDLDNSKFLAARENLKAALIKSINDYRDEGKSFQAKIDRFQKISFVF